MEETKGQPPIIDITDEAGEAHRIWIIQNSSVLEKITEMFREKHIYIADGHHRYETALEYAQEMQEQGQLGYDYVLTTLVNVFDPGLLVLPTHRLVRNPSDFNIESILERLAVLFEVQEFGTLSDLPKLMTTLMSKENAMFLEW